MVLSAANLLECKQEHEIRSFSAAACFWIAEEFPISARLRAQTDTGIPKLFKICELDHYIMINHESCHGAKSMFIKPRRHLLTGPDKTSCISWVMMAFSLFRCLCWQVARHLTAETSTFPVMPWGASASFQLLIKHLFRQETVCEKNMQSKNRYIIIFNRKSC